MLEINLDGKWVSPSYDHFGYPIDYRRPEGFSANGHCWQRLGIHGTFLPDVGAEALANFKGRHPQQKVRLVRREMSQQTTFIMGDV